MSTDHIKDEILKLEFQVERLDDLALSMDDPEFEEQLRNISADFRKSIDLIRDELEPEETPWFADKRP